MNGKDQLSVEEETEIRRIDDSQDNIEENNFPVGGFSCHTHDIAIYFGVTDTTKTNGTAMSCV